MKKHHDFPFRYQILLLCLSILLVALLLFFLASDWLFSNAFLKESQLNAVNELSLISQNVDYLVESAENSIRQLSADSELQSILKEYSTSDTVYAQSHLAFQLRTSWAESASTLLASFPHIIGCYLRIGDNVIYASNRLSALDTQTNLLENHLTQTHLTAAPVWLPNLFPVAINSDYGVVSTPYNVIAVSKKIIERANGYPLGTITLFLDETAFSTIYDGNTRKDYYLLDQNAVVTSCSDKSLLYQSALDVFHLSEKQWQQLQEDQNIITSHNGVDCLLTLVHNEHLNWDLVRLTDLASMTQGTRHTTLLLIITFLAMTMVSSVVLWFSSNSISRPISILIGIMQKYDGHNLSLRAPNDLPGEMGVLGRVFNLLLTRIEKNIHDIEAAQELHHQNELRLLQEQIKPHFLYNTLQTIASLIMLKRYDESLDSVYALSDFYKYCLSSGKDVIPLQDELVIIEKYLKIQHMRYQDYFDYTIDVEESLKTIPLPKLTLQPVVENALYHGLKPKGHKGILMITGRETRRGIVIEIMDSGVGMTQEQVDNILHPPVAEETTDSFGLQNVQERLSLLYGEQFDFDIKSVPNEYTNVLICFRRTETEMEDIPC